MSVKELPDLKKQAVGQKEISVFFSSSKTQIKERLPCSQNTDEASVFIRL